MPTRPLFWYSGQETKTRGDPSKSKHDVDKPTIFRNKPHQSPSIQTTTTPLTFGKTPGMFIHQCGAENSTLALPAVLSIFGPPRRSTLQTTQHNQPATRSEHTPRASLCSCRFVSVPPSSMRGSRTRRLSGRLREATGQRLGDGQGLCDGFGQPTTATWERWLQVNCLR